jgi:hypothetical protein
MGDRLQRSSVSMSRIGGDDAAVMRPAVHCLRSAEAIRAAEGRPQQGSHALIGSTVDRLTVLKAERCRVPG